MKKLILVIAFILAGMGIYKAQGRNNVDFNYFYHTLAPYGEWISMDGNLVVWRPATVQIDWRPYSIGSWSWTENGWYWDSYEPFGWATYHYGRWIFDDYYGWVWIPDTQWAPAWVEWRYDDNYIGWAPLPPYASFHVDFGIHFSTNWRSSYRYWNFVGYHDFCDTHVYYHFVNHSFVHKFFDRTKYRTNYYRHNDRIFNGGVHRKLVEKRAGVEIRERNISRTRSLEDYKTSRDRRDNVIREFRPEGKELQRYSGSKNIEVKRGTRELQINRNKINISGRSIDSDKRRIESRETKIDRRENPVVKNNGNRKVEVRDESKRITTEKKKSERNSETRLRSSNENRKSTNYSAPKSESQSQKPISTTRSSSSSSTRTRSRR